MIRLHFHRPSAIYAAIGFVLLACLATLGAQLGWLRGFGGDVLAVIWLYCLLRTVLQAPQLWLAVVALGCGLLLELAQYLAVLMHWQISSRALRILLGSTPDWLDVLAYGLGFVLILIGSALSQKSQVS